MIKHAMKNEPTAEEPVDFRLLLLRLGIYVDDLRLSRRLLLNHMVNDNDVVGVSHVRHSNRHRSRVWLVCRMVRSYKREVRSSSERSRVVCSAHGVGDRLHCYTWLVVMKGAQH